MLPIVRDVRRNNERRRQNRDLIDTRRVLRDSHNPFLLADARFLELFRLNKDSVQELVQLIQPHLTEHRNVRGITIMQKLLVALRFYATGAYQRGLGEEYNFGMSQASVHFCIHEITDVISEQLVGRFIKFPTDRQTRNTYKVQFFEKFGFPGTIGAIDGTHVAILKPSVEDEHNFFNRKGFHSVNCQIIVNADMKIINLFANYGGATHDSFIWSNSQIKTFMENNLEYGERAWLIGDSGYPQSRILMTPFRNPPNGSPESRYNNAHIGARNIVERSIGVLKMRFRSILKERTARYDPHFVTKIIKTCSILHNICIENNIPVPAEVAPMDDQPPADMDINNMVHEGMLARQSVVDRYFRI